MCYIYITCARGWSWRGRGLLGNQGVGCVKEQAGGMIPPLSLDKEGHSSPASWPRGDTDPGISHHFTPFTRIWSWITVGVCGGVRVCGGLWTLTGLVSRCLLDSGPRESEGQEVGLVVLCVVTSTILLFYYCMAVRVMRSRVRP